MFQLPLMLGLQTQPMRKYMLYWKILIPNIFSKFFLFSYNTVTAHWIDEQKAEICSHTLACSKFAKRHFAECYEEEIRKVVEEYDLTLPEKPLNSDDKNGKKNSKKRKLSDDFIGSDDEDDLEISSKRFKIVHGCAGNLS